MRSEIKLNYIPNATECIIFLTSHLEYKGHYNDKKPHREPQRINGGPQRKSGLFSVALCLALRLSVGLGYSQFIHTSKLFSVLYV